MTVRLGATPRSLLQNEEITRILLPMLRMDFAMPETYAYQEFGPLALPIVTITGRHDPSTRLEDMDGWAAETGELRHIAVEGRHMFIDTEEEILLMKVCHLLRETAERDNVATPSWGSP